MNDINITLLVLGINNWLTYNVGMLETNQSVILYSTNTALSFSPPLFIHICVFFTSVNVNQLLIKASRLFCVKAFIHNHCEYASATNNESLYVTLSQTS